MEVFERLQALVPRRAYEPLLKRIDAAVARALREQQRPASFPIPNFWESSFWEPTVMLPIEDYCRPGNVVFDVGANAGALSMAMSRRVGPRGVVLAFEASPRIIDKTHYNLVNAGCSNVQTFHKAVFGRSGEVVKIYPGNHLNDSIVNNLGAEGGAVYEVETVALDDIVKESGLMPSFIKMDIEGAEFDALQGMPNILAEGHPTLVLEQSPEDMRCFDLLAGQGYIAVDLANYRRITSAKDFEAGVGITNLLFLHESNVAGDPYANAGKPVEVTRWSAADFSMESGRLRLRKPAALPKGRYLCQAEFTAEGTDNEIFAGIDGANSRLLRYHTYTKLMAESYRSWVFSLSRPGEITPYLEFLRGTDTSLNWKGATLYRYDAFETLAPRVFA